MIVNDRVFERLEEAALAALDDYMAYRTYQGENEGYYKKARLGIPVLSTYGRVRGTRANERQLAIIESRLASGEMIVGDRPALAGQSGQPVTGELVGAGAPAGGSSQGQQYTWLTALAGSQDYRQRQAGAAKTRSVSITSPGVRMDGPWPFRNMIPKTAICAAFKRIAIGRRSFTVSTPSSNAGDSSHARQ